jgi:hypothetical protein
MPTIVGLAAATLPNTLGYHAYNLQRGPRELVRPRGE